MIIFVKLVISAKKPVAALPAMRSDPCFVPHCLFVRLQHFLKSSSYKVCPDLILRLLQNEACLVVDLFTRKPAFAKVSDLREMSLWSFVFITNWFVSSSSKVAFPLQVFRWQEIKELRPAATDADLSFCSSLATNSYFYLKLQNTRFELLCGWKVCCWRSLPNMPLQ